MSKRASISCALAAAAYTSLAHTIPAKEHTPPRPEILAQTACTSPKPLLVFDTFSLLRTQYGSAAKPGPGHLDLNADGIPDAHHGDLVAAVAAASGKTIIRYQVPDIFPGPLAASFTQLADDIDAGRIDPAAIIASIVFPLDLKPFSALQPDQPTITVDNVTQYKDRLTAILANYPAIHFQKLSDAIARISARGIPVFVAAGNTGPDATVNVLALIPGVYAVGAINLDGKPTAFTNTSSLVNLWRTGRFVVTKTPTGLDINADDHDDFSDTALSQGHPIALQFNGKPVHDVAKTIPTRLLNLPAPQPKKIAIINALLPEGIYPAADLLAAYGYGPANGNTIHSLRDGQWMHHPSTLVFKEQSDGTLLFDPDNNGAQNQIAVFDATSFATPNICAPAPLANPNS